MRTSLDPPADVLIARAVSDHGHHDVAEDWCEREREREREAWPRAR